ncbi:uncharacterized protein LOC126237323 [Schistocerca nitens]|uniref:uncharacterized protein LOC126237323 n=1 Tax=Schistocerca nitens TaxID=7011 RepID=UPI002118C55D|nr:uncharacterized protein LOC126237323 [Schistocerca nitens]
MKVQGWSPLMLVTVCSKCLLAGEDQSHTMRRLLLLAFCSAAVARVLDDSNEVAEAIKCYVCDSTKDSRCADPFSDPEDLLMTCPGEEADSCVKNNFEGGAERCCLCDDDDKSPGCCVKHGPGRVETTTILCFAHGCNGSDSDDD